MAVSGYNRISLFSKTIDENFDYFDSILATLLNSYHYRSDVSFRERNHMIEAIIAAVVGIVLGVGGHLNYERKRVSDGKTKAEKEIATAQKKASDIILHAKD